MKPLCSNILLNISAYLHIEHQKNYKYISKIFRDTILEYWDKKKHSHTIIDLIKFNDMENIISGKYLWGDMYNNNLINCQHILSNIALSDNPKINIFRYIVRKIVSNIELLKLNGCGTLHETMYNALYSKISISANNKIKLSKIIVEECMHSMGTMKSIFLFIEALYCPEKNGDTYMLHYGEFKYCNFDIVSQLIQPLYQNHLDGYAHNMLVSLFISLYMTHTKNEEFKLCKLNKFILVHKKILFQYNSAFTVLRSKKSDIEKQIFISITNDYKYIFTFLCKIYMDMMFSESKISPNVYIFDNQRDMQLYIMEKNKDLYDNIMNYYQYISCCYSGVSPIIFGKFLIYLDKFFDI